MPPYENEVTVSASDYDGFADAYSVENESGLFNAYYERPAVLRLAGDVSGRRILDAGCGSGPLSAALRAKGAVVTGFDVSAAMVDLARERLGEDADVRVADLRAPLPYADAEFDDVVASLVLHYLEDWGRPLAELRRVLKPGGRLILSVNHPSAYAIVYPEANYFALTKYSEDYLMDGQTVWLTFWHRPLHAMTDALPRQGSASSLSANHPRRRTLLRNYSLQDWKQASRSCASSSSSSRPFETELHLLLGLRPAKRHRRSRARSRRRSRRRSRSGSLR